MGGWAPPLALARSEDPEVGLGLYLPDSRPREVLALPARQRLWELGQRYPAVRGTLKGRGQEGEGRSGVSALRALLFFPLPGG